MPWNCATHRATNPLNKLEVQFLHQSVIMDRWGTAFEFSVLYLSFSYGMDARGCERLPCTWEVASILGEVCGIPHSLMNGGEMKISTSLPPPHYS